MKFTFEIVPGESIGPFSRKVTDTAGRFYPAIPSKQPVVNSYYARRSFTDPLLQLRHYRLNLEANVGISLTERRLSF
jgi:hypothetical protein